MSTAHAFLARAFAVLAIALALPFGATRAQALEQECPTWFPDFRCDRSGRYEGFQRPIVQPFLFEDPFITTGIYPYYLWHDFPKNSALGDGNDGGALHVAAVQLRVALTDRLALIASRDGFVWSRPENPLLRDQQGWLNLGGGLKYALVDMPEKNFILTPGLKVEFSTGSSSVFDGGNNVIFMPFVSTAWGLGDFHVIADAGAQIPSDGDVYSSYFYQHLYLDYEVMERFQPFAQVSWQSYYSSGDGSRSVRLRGLGKVPISLVESIYGDFEGVDVHNLGSEDVTGNNYLTWAVGAHVPITKHVTFSAAYERPITERHDITKQRVTASFTIEY
jgi:hypothetical protein